MEVLKDIVWKGKEAMKTLESFPYFLFNYVYTVKLDEITNRSEVRKFPRYLYLEVLAEELEEPKDVLIEKSRQMLMTWFFAALFLWDILGKTNWADFVTSRKENIVDDGGSASSWKSFMGKVRFIYERLPDFLKPPLNISYMKIINPLAQSGIYGEAPVVDAGRSMSWNRALMDEAAKLERGEQIFSSLRQACKKGIILLSTPHGKGNVFARIRFSKESSFEKYRVHWSFHPERDKSWFKMITKDMTEEQIAEELEISYEKSKKGLVYGNFDYMKQVRRLEVIPELPINTAWDFGIGDPTAIIVFQEVPNPHSKIPYIHIIDEFEDSGKTPDYYAGWLLRKYPKERLGYHYGDPAGKARSLNLKSWISWLREYGINIRFRSGYSIPDRILATKRIIPYLVVDDRCMLFLDRINNYRFPVDKEGRVIDDRPVHDWASHMMTALEFYAIYRFPIKRKREVEVI